MEKIKIETEYDLELCSKYLINQGVKKVFIILNDIKYVANSSISNTLYNEYVDLGLPSGIKWAKYNVGAES